MRAIFARCSQSMFMPVAAALTAGVLALLVAPTVAAQTASPSDTYAPRYYAAANHVEITTPMPSDVVVAGRNIDIAQSVAGDILAAGWRVALSGQAHDDVRIAAGEVVVNAPVSGDVTLAGGDVTLGSQAHIAGRSWITGRTVRIEGVFDRELEIAGATVQFAGEARMPMRVTAENFELLPGARVLAPITYRGTTEMKVADGAVVSGPVSYQHIERREAARARSFPTGSTLLFSIHLFLAGLLVLAFVPRMETSAVEMLRQHPGKSVLAGFVLLVTVPMAALLLVISILGLPFGLALGALYAIALFCGLLATTFFVGEMEAKLARFGPVLTRGQHTLLLLAGVLTLALLRSMLGGIVVFAAVLFGLGALMLALYDQYSKAPAPATT